MSWYNQTELCTQIYIKTNYQNCFKNLAKVHKEKDKKKMNIATYLYHVRIQGH